MAAFASINTRADVTYLGTVKSDGKTYYQVSFRSAIVHPGASADRANLVGHAPAYMRCNF